MPYLMNLMYKNENSPFFDNMIETGVVVSHCQAFFTLTSASVSDF